MSPISGDPITPGVVAEHLAVDADRIVTDLFPDIGLRSWRRYDSSGKCPRGFKIGGRKLYRVADLKLWAEWGFPDRDTFESRLRSEKGEAA